MSPLRVRVLIPARNEEQRIGKLLASVARGLVEAERLGARWQVEVVVALDRCSDRTREIAAQHGAQLCESGFPFGKVAALRAGMSRDVQVHVCVDADVVLGPRTLFDLVHTLESDSAVLASCPPLAPEPLTLPATPLAWALHRYNGARGFSSERLWLSGRCYALRFVDFPPELVAEDIWLSRALLAQSPRAVRHVDTDPVSFRAPSTLRGMSRTYRRLRRELARVDRLFPELSGPGRDRRVDRLVGPRDRLAYTIFRGALALCKLHAELADRYDSFRTREPDPWPVVAESKR